MNKELSKEEISVIRAQILMGPPAKICDYVIDEGGVRFEKDGVVSDYIIKTGSYMVSYNKKYSKLVKEVICTKN